MNRAYSQLQIKSFDDDLREIHGIATTPRTDRMEDIIESGGATYNLPLPLLWQHDSRSPIGHVMSADVSADGIRIRAKLARTDEPGALKDRLDEAWQSIKMGLVRGLSIGFRPLGDPEPIKGTWGLHFKEWEWLELSAVTIPANMDANIQTIKSFDTGAPAASGNGAPSSPGASGTVVKLTQPKPKEKNMTLKERIAAFEAKRAANLARIDEIDAKAGDEGRTKDESEREEYNTLKSEIKSVDLELVDLRERDTYNVTQAKAVNGNGTQAAADSRDTQVVVRHPEKLEPGIEFARHAMVLGAAKGDVSVALRLAETHYPQQVRSINVLKAAQGMGTAPHRLIDSLMQTKAAVAAGTTTDNTWAEPLLQYNQFAGDFVEFLRARTIIGRFGTDGIPSLRRVPFNVHIRGQTSGGAGYWVGEGKPKPVTKFDFNDTYLGYTKLAAISVLTEELIRFSNPSAERLVRDALASAIIAKIDTDFVDPAVAAVAGVNPASITNGVAAGAGSGLDAAAVRADLAALWAAGIAANLPLTSAVYITTPTIALNLSLMFNALGQREFPDMSLMGGTLAGIPVIVSNYVPAGTFILVYADEIWLADDGVVTVDASREASIEMLDGSLVQDATAGTGASLVSMFQTNSVALRAERFINWAKRRSTAVALVEDVLWGTAAT